MIKPAPLIKQREPSARKNPVHNQIFNQSPPKQSHQSSQQHQNEPKRGISSSQALKSQENNKVADILNGPTEKAFMRYYEENIKLKKELEDRNCEIQDLKKKLTQMMNLNKTSVNPYTEFKQLKEDVKKTGPVRGQSAKGKSFYNTTKGNGETKKVENLLQIIEHYKQKLLIAEEESANLRRQKILLEQEVQLKSKSDKPTSFNQSDNFKIISKEQDLLTKLKQKSSQYELQHQKNKFLDAELRRLQNKIKTMQWDSDQLEQLKVENRILEERIMKLTYVTDNSQGFDRRALQDKNRELETKLKAGIEKYSKIKDDKMKLEVDLKLIQNKLIELQHQLQQTQQENLSLKKNEINDPVIQKLIKNKELMAQVVAQLETSKPKSQTKELTKYQTVQKLIFEKQALARELLNIKEKMKNMEEAWKEKETMIKIEKEEMLQQLNIMPVPDKNVRYTSKQGVQYDGDISSFSDTDTIGNTKGINFFDIYLGQVNLIESLVKNVANISSVNNPLIIATVDLYNFETKHTKTIQGLNTSFNTEFTFRIVEDEFFFRFMNKGSLKISIWASEGNREHVLGTVQVPLKQLILKNKNKIAPVINTSSPIVHSQKVVGTIQYDMRMRFPIYEQVAHIMNEPLSADPRDENAPKRKLIVQIDEGYDFPVSANLFVYYPFRLEDYNTKTSKGPQPKWGHYKMIDVTYNEDLKNYLRKTQLEFIVFDDNAVLYDGKDSDVVGSASLSLVPLLELASSSNPIRQKLQIKKNGMRSGWIDVKVFWYEPKDQLQKKETKKKQQLMDSLHEDVVKFIRDINSSAEQQFRMIDKNGSGMVSFEEFMMWMSRVKKSHEYSQDFISKYYDTFSQPLNLMNWMNRLQQKSQEERRQVELMPELGMINQLLRKNSVQISSQVTLREYLKDKQLFNETLSMDQDRNGMITRAELIKYMKERNIAFDETKLKQEKINLYQFLKQYSS